MTPARSLRIAIIVLGVVGAGIGWGATITQLAKASDLARIDDIARQDRQRLEERIRGLETTLARIEGSLHAVKQP